MLLSDTSVRRPVVATVGALLVVILGVLAFQRLPVREYPDIDPPVINVSTWYRGAAPEVMESRVTRPLEDQLSTIPGIRLLRSSSAEQTSNITLEFEVGVDLEAAANDVRDRVGRARGQLPQDVVEPQVSKVEADASPFIRLVLLSESLSQLELGDLADRVVKSRLQTLPGVGAVEMRVQTYAMRVWLSPERLAAHGLTAADVERALRQQNVDIPGGRVTSLAREFPIRVEGGLDEVADFEGLVLAARAGALVHLRDVGRVELGQADYRTQGFFNGRASASLGVIRQSRSNLLDVSARVKAELPAIRAALPAGVQLLVGFDTTPFVERSVQEVYRTILEASALVILVIFAFLRDWRSTLVPLLAIPVSIIGTFAVMLALGFTVNLLTLLALVLSVGLVVDDAIVVLENIYRRIEEGEAPVRAAVLGTRQVAFAVIATTAVLAAVFLPVAFQSGQTGRLFFEFGLTLAVAVGVSAFVALSLTPMLCSRLLHPHAGAGAVARPRVYRWTEPFFVWLNAIYASSLRAALRHRFWVLLLALVATAAGPAVYPLIQRELVPTEDRGVFRGFFLGPPGATPEYVRSYAVDLERILRDYPEVDRFLILTGMGGGNQAFIAGLLSPWEERTRSTQTIVREVNRRLAAEITGGQARVAPIRPIGGRGGSESFVVALRGPSFERLQELAAGVSRRMLESGIFLRPRVEPSPTKPQLEVRIDRAKAADLRVSVADVAAALETLMGGRRVTEFRRQGQQYDVIVQVEDADRATPADLARVQVRSGDGALVPLANLVRMEESAVPESYPHLDKIRSVNLSTQPAPGRTLGDGVAWMQREIIPGMPAGYDLVFDGETREFLESGRDTWMLFALALLFAFLILAAQFESWTHPVTIFSGVAIAVSAGLLSLWLTRLWGQPMTNNLFSQFGVILLIGLIAKNGILIVEFANQLQVEGRDAATAAYDAAVLRFRPILMTAISTIGGALPLALASGAGAETRNPLGVVVVGGLSVATLFTLFVVPAAYIVMDRCVRRLTGRGSAHGLQRAAEIARETAEGSAPH